MRSPGRILTCLRQREKLLRTFSILLGTEQKANQSPKSAETEHLFPQKELKNNVIRIYGLPRMALPFEQLFVVVAYFRKMLSDC